MKTYIAHYMSPNGANPVSGVFEFESDHRINSKHNMSDARMKMLSDYGSEAVAWRIDSIEVKKADEIRTDHQMEFDFRESVTHRQKHTVKRGF